MSFTVAMFTYIAVLGGKLLALGALVKLFPLKEAGFITTPRSTDRPIDHSICGRFNASIYAGVKTITYYLNIRATCS